MHVVYPHHTHHINYHLPIPPCPSILPQDYDSMVQLVKKLPEEHEQTQKAAIQVQYAFALNRRNYPGDRDKALKILEAVSPV